MSAKAILSGEFSCVWGHPLILLPVPLYLTLGCRAVAGGEGVEAEAEEVAELFTALAEAMGLGAALAGRGWALWTRSEIPQRMGLGSSASLVAGLAALLLRVAGKDPATVEDYWPVLRAAEDRFHGQSSGLDILGVLARRPRCLQVSEGKPRDLSPRLCLAGAQLLLVSSQTPKNTRESMALLRAKLAAERDAARALAAVGALTLELLALLEAGQLDARFQALVRQNHLLLQGLGLSHPRLDCAAELLWGLGVGGKLTGGGRGGYLLALLSAEAWRATAGAARAALAAHGFPCLAFAL